MDLQGLDTIGGNTTTGAIPASVHADTPEKQKAYRACLEFERFFVAQMLKGMNDGTKALAGGDDASSGGGSESSATSGAASSTAGVSAYQDMASDQMTQAVLDGGGVGIAGVLYGQIAAQLPAAPTTPVGTDSTKDGAA